MISAEYQKYKLVSNIIKKYKNYEFSNILERWLISIYNKYGKIIKTTENTEENKKAVSELKEKKLNIDFSKIYKQFNDFKVIELKPSPVIITFNKIKYKDFVMNVSADRMKLLKKFDKNKVGIMALRYGSIVSKGQQWSIGDEQYDHLYKEYGVRYEGFASPFNSKMMKYNDGVFCSLFKDTDEIFGSIGSFFDADMVNKRWVINPPFIDSILIKTAKRIISVCHEAYRDGLSMFVFYIMPGWFDSLAYILLLDMFNKVPKLYYDAVSMGVEILRKNQYFYEHNGKKIVAKFNSVVFAISVNDKKIDKDLCKFMKGI